MMYANFFLHTPRNSINIIHNLKIKFQNFSKRSGWIKSKNLILICPENYVWYKLMDHSSISPSIYTCLRIWRAQIIKIAFCERDSSLESNVTEYKMSKGMFRKCRECNKAKKPSICLGICEQCEKFITSTPCSIRRRTFIRHREWPKGLGPAQILYLNEWAAPLFNDSGCEMDSGRRHWTNPHRLSLLNGAPIHLWVSEPPVPAGRPRRLPPPISPRRPVRDQPLAAQHSVFSNSLPASGCQMRCAKNFMQLPVTFARTWGAGRLDALPLPFLRALPPSDLSKALKCCWHVVRRVVYTCVPVVTKLTLKWYTLCVETKWSWQNNFPLRFFTKSQHNFWWLSHVSEIVGTVKLKVSQIYIPLNILFNFVNC